MAVPVPSLSAGGQVSWLRTAWAWLRTHAWLAVVVSMGALASLWRLAVGREKAQARRADAEAARADAARASAERERRVQDAIRAIETRAAHVRAGIASRQADDWMAVAKDAETLRADVESSGSAADEVNRRMDKRGE